MKKSNKKVRWLTKYIKCIANINLNTEPCRLSFTRVSPAGPPQFVSAGVTTNSATATNCVSLYDLRGIH